jgi:OOP family OmpA-OmpF porin
LRSSRLSSHLLGTALALAVASAAPSAAADGIALDRFNPAPAGDRMFGVPSPFAAGGLTPHVMLLADYAHNPLVLRTVPGNSNVGNIVSGQLFLHLDGGLSLWNRVYINLDVPVALYQGGNTQTVEGVSFAAPGGAEFGDLRIGARVRLFGEYYDPFQIGINGYVWAPTAKGSSALYVGDGKARGLPQVVIGGHTDRIVWTAAGGPEIRAAEQVGGTKLGNLFEWGAGIGFLLGDERHLQLGVETYGSITLGNIEKHTTNSEVLADLRYRVINDLEIAIGAGPGLTSGIGTPDFRGVLSIAYTPEPPKDRDGDGIWDKDDACPDVRGVHTDDPQTNGCPPPPDRDGDGIPDDVDACPDVKGIHTNDPKTNGCPSDRDGDGIWDQDDACPDVKGIHTDDPKTNGCPPPPADRDGDGIPDIEDACPDIKGIRTSDPKTNGCPPRVDTDGDGIFDDEDACPLEKGPRDPDPTRNGCPRVHVTETEVFILEQVQFDTGKSTIKRVSDPLLDEVANVLKQHPELLKLEVQGHTDDRGTPGLNRTLSDARAKAVMKALVKRGIVAGRLTARGYGQDKPIAPNTTDEGRTKNRRVQFTILEKKPKAPAP